MVQILRRISTTGSNEIQLLEGDITRVDVDAIVNPANSHLMHGGGLAGVLDQKAGPTLQQESTAWVQEHGPVRHHSPAYTSAGALPFQYIIHAVGPIWGSGDEEAKLRAAVLGSLKKADELKLSAVALPAISCGVFGYPLQEAAGVILKAVRDYTEQERDSGLARILVVLYGEPAASVFTRVWDRTMP